MNIVMNGSTLVLEGAHTLGLRNASGAVAEVKSGRLWITMEHDRRDVVLESGDRWTIDRDGLTLMSAEEPSSVVLSEPRAASLLERMRAAAANAVRALRVRQPRPVPYY